MVKKMRDEQIENDQILKTRNKEKQNKTYLPSLYDKDGKVDIQKFKPSAKELIGMTPSQKQDVIKRLKFISKAAEQQDEEDPEKIKSKVDKGELHIYEAHKKIQELASSKSRSKNIGGPRISTI